MASYKMSGNGMQSIERLFNKSIKKLFNKDKSTDSEAQVVVESSAALDKTNEIEGTAVPSNQNNNNQSEIAKNNNADVENKNMQTNKNNAEKIIIDRKLKIENLKSAFNLVKTTGKGKKEQDNTRLIDAFNKLSTAAGELAEHCEETHEDKQLSDQERQEIKNLTKYNKVKGKLNEIPENEQEQVKEAFARLKSEIDLHDPDFKPYPKQELKEEDMKSNSSSNSNSSYVNIQTNPNNHDLDALSNRISNVDSKLEKLDRRLSGERASAQAAELHIIKVVKSVHDLVDQVKRSQKDSDCLVSEAISSFNRANQNEELQSLLRITKETRNELVDLSELKELKNIQGDIEIIAGKVNKIDANLIESQSGSQSKNASLQVPKQEKSIVDLVQYMRDGLENLEHMSRKYVASADQLADLAKLKEQGEQDKKQAFETGLKKGELDGRIKLIREIYEKFPTMFNDISNLFKQDLSSKYLIDDVVYVTNDNKTQYLTELEFPNQTLENGQYKIIKQAILLDGKILAKAIVEAADQQKVEA